MVILLKGEIMPRIFNRKYILFYKKFISLSLTFLILFNAATQAFANIEFIPQAIELPEELQTEIQNTVTESVEEVVTEIAEKSAEEEMTPEEFLANLLESLKEATKENSPSEQAQNQEPDQYRKLTKEEYTNLYNEQINNEYRQYYNDIQKKERESLAAFDEEAQKLIQAQEYTFNISLPILNFSLPTFEKKFGEGKTITTLGQNLTLNTSTPSSIEQAMTNLTTRESILNELNDSIAQQKEEYIAEVNAWKEKSLADLRAEKSSLLANIDASYNSYSEEYNTKLREFYTSLMDKIIENFKKTSDMESKKNFVSILFFLTSIKSPEIDRNDFIKGDNKDFIYKFLRNNFSKEGNACASSIKTRYKSNYNYSTVRGIGGSPSARLIFENSDSKESYLHVENQEACDLALSSMLPYANLNGYGYNILNFVRQYYNQPLFGSMLAIAVKSLLLTESSGKQALTQLIDESIRLENQARTGKTSTWNRFLNALDYITFEGIANRLLYDDKFCHHNICSSSNLGIGESNAWEEVAYMLADADRIDLLNKAVDQCEIVSTNNYYQHMECKGIYPFLLGALVSKPEIANRITPLRQLSEIVGSSSNEQDQNQIITQEDAEKNKKLNDAYDITRKHTQGEWIGAILTLQSFIDLYPTDMLRINNLIADTPALNSKNDFHHYDENSDWYKTKVRRFNNKQVIVPIASYADFLIAIRAMGDLVHLGIVFGQKTVTLSKMMSILRSVKGLPNSLYKAEKIAKLLELKKVSPQTFFNFVKFNQKPLVYVTGRMNAIALRAGAESNALVVSVSGRITGVKNEVLIGTREVARPLSNPRGKIAIKTTPLGGSYFVRGAETLRVTETGPTNFREAMVKVRTAIAESPFNPFIKPNTKDVPNLNLEGLTLEVVDKKGNPIKIEKITIEDKVLYVNGEMFKTFKATLPEDQLEIVSNLIKNHNISLGANDFYVKPLWQQAPSGFEKASARWHSNELFNVYDGEKNVIMQLGLNRGYKQDLKLINDLDNSAKLIYVNNALHMQKGTELFRIEGIQGLSLPKTALFNMARDSKVAFLNDLFSMPARADQLPPLRFKKTRSKIFWPYITQALSYSAASTSLMMTMEKEPFNFSPAASVTIGLFLPYIWSFTSPFMVPLVKMWGAKPVLLGSLAFAGVGLGLTIANGYHGNVTNELDEEGRVIPRKDADGNIIEGSFEIRKNSLPTWPLFIASAFTGIASAGVRASSNILIKGYELNRRTLPFSMLFKNVGGMAFTAVPFAANALAKMDNDKFRNKRKDFSVTYPVLLALTAVAAAGIALKMPKMNVPHYKPTKADFLVKPWKLLFTPQIAPYTIGMMGVCSLEGYVYFKGANAFARDTFEEYGYQGETAKFLASLSTAIPQFTLRLLSPRKVYYGYGLLNSVILATTGTLLLALPSDNLSITANTAIGIAAGTALGLGTAQVYQYSQKLVLAQAARMADTPIKDTQTLYSMSNLGLVLPTLYAMSANKRKTNLNESEFEATRNTFYWPLMSYFLGAGAIADAERGFKTFPYVMKNIVKPAIRFSVEGATLNKSINNFNTYFRPTLQQNSQFTPSLLQPASSNFNLQNPLLPPTNNIFVPSEINGNNEINNGENNSEEVIEEIEGEETKQTTNI